MGGEVVIICAGSLEDPSRLVEETRKVPAPVVLCADGGARHAADLGIVPQAVIGDMDSVKEELLVSLEEKGSAIIRYPVAKDQTDTELALSYALGLSPSRIVIFAALGTRVDHSLANIFLMARAVPEGIDLRILDHRCEIMAVTGETSIMGEPGTTVSILPFSPAVSGVTLEGFEYPLRDATMEMGTTRGISNRLLKPEGKIRVEKGRLLVIVDHSV